MSLLITAGVFQCAEWLPYVYMYCVICHVPMYICQVGFSPGLAIKGALEWSSRPQMADDQRLVRTRERGQSMETLPIFLEKLEVIQNDNL